MKDASRTAFSLENYRFYEFSFKTQSNREAPINVSFHPSGKYYTEFGRFELTLNVKCSVEGEQQDFISAGIVANFLFDPPVKKEEIPDFFYVNSIAIIFPYVRAFISTLSLQSNSGLVYCLY